MMNFISIFYVILFYFWNVFLSADATAMLKPSHRGTMWTRTNYNSAGYNYMGINCGGIGRLKQNNGKCGLCGDPFNGVRKHESGGKYATGAIADVIDKGQRNIYVKILLNSDQSGYFEFHLCVTNGTAETKACFDKHLLKISEGRNQGDQFAYYVDRAGIIPLTVEVPDGVYCDRCVLQWKYVTGNTFGRDEHGVGCLGCGHQETYINCADITIKGWEIPTTPVPPTTPIPTTVWWTTTVAPTTRPPPPPPTTTTPTPTTRAPSTTAAKVVQITKAKVITKNTQPSNRQFTRQRRPATDFDEGSRRRSQYNRYPDAQGSAPAQAVAPKTQAIVPASVFRSNSLDSSQNRLTDIAVQPKAEPAVAIVPEKVATTTVKILPEVKEIKPSILPKRQSGPFKIPRPPRLTFEQIDALNNKNGQPGHDPLQKYANVGSSRLVAAVDFTTVRAQQVATPPTTSKLDKFNQRSTDSTVNIYKAAKSAPSAEKTPDLFSSFGNEMLGAPPQLESAAQPTQNFGMDLINEYGIIPSVSPRGKFVSQMKDRNNNRGTHSNEFSSSNSIRQNSQVSQNMNH
ncbi:uncharacterized protein LOC132743477, partial [Ruditapes philippinarum]|uniref:uncharacterized protein LOC132743477 n=1 Tax=Ruditapes philippinarum TaxID=129788 RepID=UPI00295BB59C